MTTDQARRIVERAGRGDDGYNQAMEELEAAYGLPAVLYPIHVMALGKPPPFTYDYKGISRLREHFIPHLEGIMYCGSVPWMLRHPSIRCNHGQ